MKIAEIFEKIASDNNITVGYLCTDVGFKRSYTYDVMHGRTKTISLAVAQKIVSRYPQYKVAWIMTGEGEPYTEEFKAQKEVKQTKSEVDDLRDQVKELYKQIAEKDRLIAEMVADKAEADREYRRQISNLVATITNQTTFGSSYGMAEPVPHPQYKENKQ